jgi:hypothetical protein
VPTLSCVTGADPLEVAAWRLAVGTLASEDLPGLATDALVRGLDSPALRVLAGQPRDDVRESADLFRVVIDELGIEVPDAETAWWHLIRRTAADMVTGRIGPADGAAELWLAYERVRDNGDLRIFVGLASELEDHPEAAEQLVAAMVAEARDLLARPVPRRWLRLMAARGRSPLTLAAGCDSLDVDPELLPFGDGLRVDLARWDERFQAMFSRWPAAGGFETELDAEQFVAEGERLVSQLQDELGASYHVEYMPEPIRPPGVRIRRRRGWRRWAKRLPAARSHATATLWLWRRHGMRFR